MPHSQPPYEASGDVMIHHLLRREFGVEINGHLDLAKDAYRAPSRRKGAGFVEHKISRS